MSNTAVATIDPQQVYSEIRRGKTRGFKEEVLARGYRDSSSSYMTGYLRERDFYLDGGGFLADRNGEKGSKSSFVLVGWHDAGVWGKSPSVIRTDYNGNFRQALEKNLRIDPEYFSRMTRSRRPVGGLAVLVAGLEGLNMTSSVVGGVVGLAAGMCFVRGIELLGQRALKKAAKEKYGSDFDLDAVEAVLKEGLIE